MDKKGILAATLWSVLLGSFVYFGLGWDWWHYPLAFVSFFVTWSILESTRKH